MTIKLNQLDVPTGVANDMRELGAGNLLDLMPMDVLTFVRHIMRDIDCDMIPRVIGHGASETPNQWGDDMFIHVQYSKRGWQATYGARYVGGTFVMQCYMS